MDLFFLSRANKAFLFPIFSVLPSLLRILLLSSLLFFSSFVFDSKASAQKQCIEDHFSALLHLKQAFHFSDDSLTTLSSWNPDNRDCCSWEGITCDGDTGYVIGLDLSDLQTSGRVDSESLFHLRSLQRLNLGGNNFDPSPIPHGFDQLMSLTHLNLSFSHFYGQIPLEISSLTNLVSLDLSYNNGNESLPLKLEKPNIRALVQNLSSLRELFLDWVMISAQGSDWADALSSALPHLRKLSLRYCGLSGPIHSSLSKLRFLAELHLSFNDLSSAELDFIGNFSSLTSLRLRFCELHGKFPDSIFWLPNLHTLDIGDNPFLTGHLPEFPRNNSLQQLVLPYTGFSGRLPDSLANLKQLTMIDLRDCNLSGPLPSSLANLNNLISLDLSLNSFSGPIHSYHGSSLFSLPSLQKLNLRNNQFSGQLSEFQNASSSLLEIIYLDNNSFAGPIPKTIFELPKLRILSLSSNNFISVNFQNESSSLLEMIHLDDNNLQGTIPRSIFELKRLTDLSLSSNNLSGTVDLALFQNLRNLTFLDLSENCLSLVDGGSNSSSISFPQFQTLVLRSCNINKFPNILRKQEQLSVLDLSNNKINGEIPRWIWKVGNGNLRYLNLSHNALEGLEQPYPHLSSSVLEHLDLSFNKLQGSISIPLPSFFLSLSSNNLSGDVPSLICDCTSIQVIDLSDNHFSGTIPPCLGEISVSLNVLNLGGNRLHGTLLQTFEEGCNLMTLDLNGNQLEGKLPRSLTKCKMLEVLNLGNNQIHDTFPFWLDDLSQLRILILRSNKFYGTIGHPLTNHMFPLLQIFDLSCNSFTGSLPSNIFRSWKAMMEEGQSHFQFLSKGVFNGYYQDKVTIVSKGLEMNLVKILTAFTVVDLSNNQFCGDIPISVGDLKSLLVLNMSYNLFTGRIPTSLGNLRNLESLDLSQNILSGKIPDQLVKLTFLAVLNLSQNHLIGSIPQSQQFLTFTNESFQGNLGLCGPPLSMKCGDAKGLLPSAQSESKYDWNSMWIGFGVGYGVGLGILSWTPVLWT